jgi:hypothetical protein
VSRARGPTATAQDPPGTQERTRSPPTRDAHNQATARHRRPLHAQERLARARRQAPHAAKALPPARAALGLPADLVTAIAGRFRSPQQLLGQRVGRMGPPLCGCRTHCERCRVRGGDKQLPARVLGVRPQRSWRKRRRRLGLEVLVPLWQHAASTSEATRRRWHWTGGGDDAVCKKDGAPLGRVGPWWRGQAPRGLSGLAGLLLVVVMGDGPRVGPVDLALRRPAPTGPGAPCRDHRPWGQSRREGRGAAFRRRGVDRPPPLLVAESGCSDSTRMRQVATTPQGPCLVAGTRPEVFAGPEGRQGKGGDGQTPSDGPGRHSPQVPGRRDARGRATSPTYGAVTIIVVRAPREEQCDVRCLDTAISGPRLIRAWPRRHWIEPCFRTLTPVVATGACPGHSAEAYYGHWVRRLMGCLVLVYPARVVCQGRLTMEESILSRKHDWRFVDSEPLELTALSQGVDEKAT